MDTTNEQTIIQWLQQNIMRLHHVEAGNGFDDLQPLKTILKDVKIIGLGETTHGTREFFQLKHRLMEFLVTEMGFTVFTIEAGYASCQPINDYVLYGEGDRETVLTGQWYVVWDTEEMAAMLDWMRAYNQTVPDERKVKFYGVDINRNENGRQAVLDYLRKVDPDSSTNTEPLFAALAVEESKWSRRIDEEAKKTMVQLLPRLEDLTDHLTVNKDRFVSHSSLTEFDQALLYIHIMKQWIRANAADVLSSSQSRSNFMAENLIYLIDRASPDTKFILWEHNYHIAVNDVAIEESNMGYDLRQKYGQGYYAFGFEFNQGSFHTRLVQPDKLLGDLKEVTLPPSSAGKLAWYLAHLNTDALILNLRTSPNNKVVEQWLDTSQGVHNAGWAYNEEATYNVEQRIIRKYDGIIFVDTTTASRPTVNALKTVANRDGL